MNRPPSDRELDALRAWIRLYGRTWKHVLMEKRIRGRLDVPELVALHNRLGPSGIRALRTEDIVGTPRGNPGRTSDADPIAAHELVLYAVNDGDLFRQKTTPIIQNLARKVRARTYDPAKSALAWQYLADAAAPKYLKEYGSEDDVRYTFTAATRRLAAAEFAAYYTESVMREAKKATR